MEVRGPDPLSGPRKWDSKDEMGLTFFTSLEAAYAFQDYTSLPRDSTGQRWRAARFSFGGEISRSSRCATLFIPWHFSQDESEAAYKSTYNKIKNIYNYKKIMGNINSNRVNIGGSRDKRQSNHIVQRSWKRIKKVALRFFAVKVKKEMWLVSQYLLSIRGKKTHLLRVSKASFDI